MANRQLQTAVFRKTRGRCWYCSVSLNPFGDWQIEHQTPRAQGGTDLNENLVAACRDCNSHKGNRTVEQYRNVLQARLLNQITEASERLENIQRYVGRESLNPNEPEIFYPPTWVSDIRTLLTQAEDSIRYAPFTFYGETLARPYPDVIEIEESRPTA